MTPHAEVIVFCNVFGWLVGGKDKRRGLEGKTPSGSQPPAGAAGALWPGTPRLGGAASLGLRLHWSWLSMAASPRRWATGGWRGATAFGRRRRVSRTVGTSAPWRGPEARWWGHARRSALPRARAATARADAGPLAGPSRGFARRESGRSVLGLGSGFGFFTVFSCLKRYISCCRHNLITFQFLWNFLVFLNTMFSKKNKVTI